MKFLTPLLVALLWCALASAQMGTLNADNLSSVTSEQISDQDLNTYYQKAKASNVSDAQIEQLLRARGMAAGEISKIMQRLKGLGGVANLTVNAKTDTKQNNTTRKHAPTKETLAEVELDSLEQMIYGMELFTNPSLSFEPDLQIATPLDYVVGPGDVLSVIIYGQSEASYNLKVSPEGNVFIQNAGIINVNGLTIAEADQKIRAHLAKTIYRAINNGFTQVKTTLGGIRTIKVIVIGQARKPGVYSVSSFTTLFNLLYTCGGPSKNGSFRNIEVIRAGKRIAVADLYQFLHNGSTKANIRLTENDVVKINYYDKRIYLKGAFKRPGIYELTANENLQQTIDYAGGFIDSAYREQVRITEVAGKQKEIKTVVASNFNGFKPATGSTIEAEYVYARFKNRIAAEGAFKRAGTYSVESASSLLKLVQLADGLREGAFTEKISISRLNTDLTYSTASYNLKAILNGVEPDVALQADDKVFIPVITDLRDKKTISVEGEVRKPGAYEFKSGMTVADAVIVAGGFTEAATGLRLEIGRRITNAESKDNIEIAEVINLDTERSLDQIKSSIALQPYDIVIVRTNPGYFVQKVVTVKGEVKFAGNYVLSNRNERLSDILNRAGGFTSLSNIKGVSLRRRVSADDPNADIRRNAAKKLFSTKNDSSAFTALIDSVEAYETVAIDVEEILKKPKSSIDILLQDGDVINVPSKDDVVKVKGEVLLQTQIAYIPNRRLSYYIDLAGGFSTQAQKRKAFVVASNGNGKRVKSFLIFKSNPIINAGDEIFVPKKLERDGKRVSVAEMVGITTALASVATVVIALLRL